MKSHILLFTHSNVIVSLVERYSSNVSIVKFDENENFLIKLAKEMEVKVSSLPLLIQYLSKADQVYPFDKVLSFHEHYHIIASELCNQLNIEFYYSRNLIETVNNKLLFRDFLQSIGLDNSKYTLVNNTSDIVDFANQFDYPLILKPIDGVGSLGVSIIRFYEDIQGAVDWLKAGMSNTKMLIEQFISGKEYSVEAFTANGKHQIICVTEKFKDLEHFVGLGHRLPAILLEEESEMIETTIFNLLTSLGVSIGPTHTEVIVRKKNIYIVETHIRLPGAKIPKLIKLNYDIDLQQIWIEQVMEKEFLFSNPNPNPKGYACVWFGSPNESGILRDIKGLETAKKLTNIVECDLNRNIGNIVVYPVLESVYRVVYAIALNSSSDVALQAAQGAINEISYIIEKN